MVPEWCVLMDSAGWPRSIRPGAIVACRATWFMVGASGLDWTPRGSAMRVLYALAAALALMASPAMAQNGGGANLPRTPDGHPDFQGVWFSHFVTPIERPDEVKSLVVDDAEARAMGESIFQKLVDRGAGLDPDVLAANVRNLLRVNGEWRTSLVTEPPNGKLPLTELGRRMIADWRNETNARPDGPEIRPEAERCISGNGRAPLALSPAQNMRQIVQTADSLVLYSEDGANTRIIRLDASQNRPSVLTRWEGDSLASWEGDDLVVTTVNQRGPVRSNPGGALVVRPEARVIERLRLLSRGEILYRYTIEDPAIYGAPWSAEFVLTRSDQTLFEYSCHEGNYSLVNILSSARAAERQAAQEQARPAPKPITGKSRYTP